MDIQAIEIALPHVSDPNTALDTATTKSVSLIIEPQAPVEPAGSYTVADAFETVSPCSIPCVELDLPSPTP
jgi:hypothetical protein